MDPLLPYRLFSAQGKRIGHRLFQNPALHSMVLSISESGAEIPTRTFPNWDVPLASL